MDGSNAVLLFCYILYLHRKQAGTKEQTWDGWLVKSYHILFLFGWLLCIFFVWGEMGGGGGWERKDLIVYRCYTEGKWRPISLTTQAQNIM